MLLIRKTPGRGRRITGAAVLAALGLGTGYTAWAAQPDRQAATQAITPVILAQDDTAAQGPGIPKTVERVTITKEGQTQTYEGEAIPPEVQAKIANIGTGQGPGSLTDNNGALEIHEARVISPYPGVGPVTNRTLTNFLGNGAAARIAAVAGGPGVVKMHCLRHGAGKPVTCEPLDGEAADQARALTDLANAPILSGDDSAEDFYLLVRYPG